MGKKEEKQLLEAAVKGDRERIEVRSRVSASLKCHFCRTKPSFQPLEKNYSKVQTPPYPDFCFTPVLFPGLCASASEANILPMVPEAFSDPMWACLNSGFLRVCLSRSAVL